MGSDDLTDTGFPFVFAFLKIEVKFTLHKINHFKVYISVVFSTFTMLCYHHHCHHYLVAKQRKSSCNNRSSKSSVIFGTSLVVQWLRIRLLMQRMQV